MKHIYVYTLLFFISGVMLTSCAKESAFWRDNIDPTALSEDKLIPTVLLPIVELNLAYQQGGDLFRYTSIIINTERGADRQFANYDNYSFTGEDFNNVWNSLYSETLKTASTLYTLAKQKGYNHYAAVSRLLTAYTFGMITDMWGDIPFSEALNGPTNIQPQYSTQEEVYNGCIAYIDEAIILLQSDGGDKVPSGDDIIYKGDKSKWLKFAYSLKLRLMTHLVDKKGDQYIDNALNLISNAFSSNSDDAVFSFVGATNGNPIYQYFNQRGDISVNNGYLYKTMESKYDTMRLKVWFDKAKNIVGSKFAEKESGVPLITFAEIKFLESELKARKNDFTGAKVAFDLAVKASFDFSGATQGTYTGTWDATSLSTVLNSIAYEKYVALFTNPESFNDWRRLDAPKFVSNTGSDNDLVYRFIYSTSETLYNSANVPKELSKSTKVWWDIK